MPHDCSLVSIKDIKPISVGTIPISVNQCAVTGSALIRGVLLGVHDISLLPELVDSVSEIIKDSTFTFSLLGSDEDDTVTSLGSIDRG